jgi:hypothetical protein
MSIGAWVWSGIAALSAYRAIVRSTRAVFDSAEITDCPAASRNCEPTLGVRSVTGPAPVYALVSGVVSRVVPGSVIEITSKYEPVVVSYVGPMTLNAAGVQVAPGQVVRAGDCIGQAASIGIAVSQITRLVDGTIALAPLEPASWLAARGLRAGTKLVSGVKWCQGGRSLVVPQDVAQCGLRIPDPPGFSLLPVNVRTA